MNVAIVTGASSGMGREAVKQIDKIYTDGIDEIWVIARRAEKLQELQFEIYHKLRILPLDLTAEADLQELDLTLNLTNPNVRMLVNASGYGIVGPFKGSNAREQTGMVRLNCESLTRVTNMVLGYMKRGARILQFASSAAFVPQIDFAVYAATKSYVLSYSQALNAELKRNGISVTAICPGPVDTEFFDVAEKDSSSSFKFKKFFMADAAKVVRLAMIDAYHRRSVSVYSLPMKLFMIVTKIFPHDFILKIMSLLKK